MKSTNKISFLRRMTMPLPELEAYYREQRAISFHKGEPIRGIVWRKRAHGLLHVLLTVNFVQGYINFLSAICPLLVRKIAESYEKRVLHNLS